jgi:hypothetical protein
MWCGNFWIFIGSARRDEYRVVDVIERLSSLGRGCVCAGKDNFWLIVVTEVYGSLIIRSIVGGCVKIGIVFGSSG